MKESITTFVSGVVVVGIVISIGTLIWLCPITEPEHWTRWSPPVTDVEHVLCQFRTNMIDNTVEGRTIPFK